VGVSGPEDIPGAGHAYVDELTPARAPQEVLDERSGRVCAPDDGQLDEVESLTQRQGNVPAGTDVVEMCGARVTPRPQPTSASWESIEVAE
jgi:hypothetical protein